MSKANETKAASTYSKIREQLQHTEAEVDRRIEQLRAKVAARTSPRRPSHRDLEPVKAR